MTRRALVLAAAALAAAACNTDSTATCPGDPLGTFPLQGTLASATCEAGTAAFAASVPPTFGPRDTTFSAGGANGIAVCTGPKLGAVLYGTRAGDRVSAQASTEGAVLTGCAATCSAIATYAIAGDLVFGTDGRASGIAGTYTETFQPAPGSDCGGCTLPCTAVYDIVGVP